MYRDSYEYKRYKEEYDAYQDEKEELIKEIKKEEEIEMKNTKIEEKLREAYDKVHMSLFAISKSDTLRDKASDKASIKEWYDAEKEWTDADRDLIDVDRCLKKEEELLFEFDKNHDFNGQSIYKYEKLKKAYDKFRNKYLLRSIIKHLKLIKG